jgi:antitoxin HicB
MTGRLAFAARLAPDKDERPRLVVTLCDLPEAITEGRDEREALVCAADCLEEALAGRMARGDVIPSPSRARRGEHLVRPGALVAAKVALYVALGRRLVVDAHEVA